MITIGRTPRIAAALAALCVNFALTAGLVSLAHHYEEQATGDPRALATAQAGSLRCRPERIAPG